MLLGMKEMKVLLERWQSGPVRREAFVAEYAALPAAARRNVGKIFLLTRSIPRRMETYGASGY